MGWEANEIPGLNMGTPTHPTAAPPIISCRTPSSDWQSSFQNPLAFLGLWGLQFLFGIYPKKCTKVGQEPPVALHSQLLYDFIIFEKFGRWEFRCFYFVGVVFWRSLELLGALKGLSYGSQRALRVLSEGSHKALRSISESSQSALGKLL